MAVFRCPADPSKAFVKRVIGLPGEDVRIREGDIYINNRLARKTLAEFKAVRVLVFDNNFQPWPHGFRDRWEAQPASAAGCGLGGTTVYFNTEENPQAYQCLIYRHAPPAAGQSQAIRDEYMYNGGDPPALMPVHDFMVECNLKVVQGSGWVLFGITDGSDRLIVELPVAQGKTTNPDRMARLREEKTPFSHPLPLQTVDNQVYRQVPGFRLSAGKSYHVELAFVDRRLTLAIDGVCPFPPLDFPPAKTRKAVVRPFKLGARGVKAAINNVRLFRDIYYTEVGTNGTRKVVSLGPEEYFVLGDNSPNSDDSRFWPQRGVVPLENFIGKPFLAHLPSRVVRWPGLGKPGQRIAPDWGRVRWLH
jgi:signal peptidase I